MAYENHNLSNLLAIIHRDGGHYEVEHGADKATDDATELLFKRRQIADELVWACKLGLRAIEAWARNERGGMLTFTGETKERGPDGITPLLDDNGDFIAPLPFVEYLREAFPYYKDIESTSEETP